MPVLFSAIVMWFGSAQANCREQDVQQCINLCCVWLWIKQDAKNSGEFTDADLETYEQVFIERYQLIKHHKQ